MSDNAFWTIVAVGLSMGTLHWCFNMAPYWMAERRMRAMKKDNDNA